MENGAVVGDRFTVEGRAGSGGMAAVYRATDRTTGKTVALKLLHGSTPDGEGRFAREAELLARIIHPGIVGYVAHGTTDGVPYLAMRWVEGETLGDRLKRGGPLGPEATVDLGIAVADALGAAHVQDLAVVLERLGRMHDARTMAELAIAEQTAQGDVRMEGAAHRTLAMVLIRQGELDQAISQAEAAVELSRTAKRDLGHILATLAYAQLKAGRVAEALETATHAHETDGPIMGSAAGVVMTRLVYARALLANGRANDAREALRSAHAEVQRQAGKLTDPATKKKFLDRIWENAQTLEWARQSGIE